MTATGDTLADVSRIDLDIRLAAATSPEYWLGLGARQGIATERLGARTTGFEDDLIGQLQGRGYARIESLLNMQALAHLARLVETVRETGWPQVFAFMFDDFWALAAEPALRRVAEIALDGPVALIPHLAVHHVSGAGTARGWQPHVDGRNRPNRLSTWVPLTDATLDNGCMYLVPDRDEPVRQAVDGYSSRNLTFRDVQQLLQNARALPAAAGSVLCWGFEMLHWGSRWNGSPTPRISVAFEWIAASEPPIENELPLLKLEDGYPAFETRLRFISQAICTYEGFDPALAPFRALGERVLEDSRLP